MFSWTEKRTNGRVLKKSGLMRDLEAVKRQKLAYFGHKETVAMSGKGSHLGTILSGWKRRGRL